MKLEKMITALWSCLLAFVISTSAIACVVTGFDMAVDMTKVALCCLLATVVSTACYLLPLRLVPVAAFALLGGYFWQSGSLELSYQSLVFRISRLYNSVHGWGTIRLNIYTSDDMERTLWLILCFMGALIAMGVSWSICRRKTGFVATIPAIALLAMCFVTRETAPDTVWLYMMIFGVLLVMLTHTVRRADEKQGNRLSFLVVGPLALMLLLLFVAVPRSSYDGQAVAQDIEDSILENKLFQMVFGDMTDKGTSGSSVDGSTVRLDHVGIRLESKAKILQVETDFSGTVYLRGRALDTYDGTTWTDSGRSYTGFYWCGGYNLVERGELLVRTKYSHRMMYVPCYTPLDMTIGLENTDGLTQYTFRCYAEKEETSCDYDQTYNTHLSAEVRKWAEPLVEQITQGAQTTDEKIQAIAEYVRSSARYDLETTRMPRRKTDFAKWFLQDSDTGYCIHFATAATVLLQAADIPARYVTGYIFQVEAGGFTDVVSNDAHAWVEYWVPGFGWKILEVTPSAQDYVEPAPQPTIPDDTPESAQARKFDWMILVYIGVGLIPMGMLVIVARCFFLHRSRRRRLTRGTPQQKLLARWQEAVRIAGVLKEEPPESLEEIAQKAKFSQHTPTDSDMETLDAYLADGIHRLKSRSVFYRVWYRVILVLY